MNKRTINAVVFKRTEEHEFEHGAMINDDELIIDFWGLPVPRPIYVYQNMFDEGRVVKLLEGIIH